jgi:hypothetical protein
MIESSESGASTQCTGSASADSGNNSDELFSPAMGHYSTKVSGPQNYSKIMMERWQRSNSNLPQTDKIDIKKESSFLADECILDSKHQHHPEFTQTSYLRIRSLEEVMAMKNYLDPKFDI